MEGRWEELYALKTVFLTMYPPFSFVFSLTFSIEVLPADDPTQQIIQLSQPFALNAFSTGNIEASKE
ncbi:hypothetical protein BDN72DRAFT_893548 [Pluteus cervinus]|uniref:Uncharacterized protein n=1 Tax=Pluteus cervinus TaxID=181527 RepID=A0ACD3B7M6_9AGAR|nr:hypothetical protein BDN72DRAFT_893548 [Pluteus cervinus]